MEISLASGKATLQESFKAFFLKCYTTIVRFARQGEGHNKLGPICG